LRIVVLLKQLPDLVEELEPSPDGTDIDREFIKFILNEFDDQALEEALVTKESSGAEVIVVALDEPEVDQVLYTALAKGADRAVKLTGVPAGTWVPTHLRAAILAPFVRELAPDLVLTGVQSAEDLDGQLASLLGGYLDLPHAAVVVGLEVKDSIARVVQELGSGRSVEEQITLPAVLGIQAASQAPRYAPISKIRQAMQAGGLEELEAPAPVDSADIAIAQVRIRRLYAPEKSTHAEMLTGDPGEVATRIAEILRSKGLVKA